MLQVLNHKEEQTAQRIYRIFQASYPIEAKLLGAVEFPPLDRSVEDFMNCPNSFYGIFKNDILAAATEILSNDKYTHIQSMVVDPMFFRQGLASKMIEFVFKKYNTPLYIVETGLANEPAIKLYLNHGFQKVREYDTDFGIRKICFEKKT